MTEAPRIIRTIRALQDWSFACRRQGHAIGFVPTMGALHSGHLSLVEQARLHCDKIVVSIFVNPAQFAPTEDFDAYPRTEARDIALLQDLRVDVVFAPNGPEMYADDRSTRVCVGGPAEGLETDFRPDFFNGVALVVTKLLLAALPDTAVFGEKDYQQLLVVTRFVRDLNIPTRIIGAPTVREADGLALSSRNAYLDSEQRQIAAALPRTMNHVIAALRSGAAPEATLQEGRENLMRAGFELDYLELRHPETLAEIDAAYQGSRRLLAAAWLGKTRLIDNMSV